MMRRKSLLPFWLLPLGVLILCGYLFFTLVRCQVTISSKQQELISMQTQLTNQLASNEELSRALDDGEDAIIERIAREQGYARPNERVFVDISGK